MTNDTKQSFKQSYTDNIELSIFNCGHEQCDPCHTWGPGIRDHYLIHLVVAGKGTYKTESGTFQLQAGDLFLVKPSHLVTYTADAEAPWKYYWVGFNGACANRLVQQTPFSDAKPVFHCQNPELLQSALHDIYSVHVPEPHQLPWWASCTCSCPS